MDTTALIGLIVGLLGFGMFVIFIGAKEDSPPLILVGLAVAVVEAVVLFHLVRQLLGGG
jgi:ABC-type proline/glycine betaine transport system permease subunit